MFRRARRITIAVILVLVVGAVAVLVTGRSALDHDQSTAANRWTPNRAPLDTRYQRLTALNTAVKNAGGADRDAVKDLDDALSRWAQLHRASDAAANTAAEVTTANELEGLAARLLTDISASARLQENPGVAAAVTALAAAPPPDVALAAYNDAVRKYEDTRNSLFRRVAANAFGYDSLPTFQPPATPRA